MNLKNLFLRKKRCCFPTGRLVHAAKATGFSSVSEMLQLKNPEEFQEDAGESLKKETTSKEVQQSLFGIWFSALKVYVSNYFLTFMIMNTIAFCRKREWLRQENVKRKMFLRG